MTLAFVVRMIRINAAVTKKIAAFIRRLRLIGGDVYIYNYGSQEIFSLSFGQSPSSKRERRLSSLLCLSLVSNNLKVATVVQLRPTCVKIGCSNVVLLSMPMAEHYYHHGRANVVH